MLVYLVELVNVSKSEGIHSSSNVHVHVAPGLALDECFPLHSEQVRFPSWALSLLACQVGKWSAKSLVSSI